MAEEVSPEEFRDLVFNGRIAKDMSDETFYALLRRTPKLFQQGFNDGYETHILDSAVYEERSTPPWFRRYFWHPEDSFEPGEMPKVLHLRTGCDEYCNRLVGVRMRGGILYIRLGRVRGPKDGLCHTCRKECS